MASGMRVAVLPFVVACFSWPLTARAEDMGSEDLSSGATRTASTVTETPAPSPEAAVAEAPDIYAVRRLALEAHIGFGTPVGALGIVAEYSVHPLLGLGAGIGMGSAPSNDSALHGALLARLRPLRGKNDALVLGAAYSFGGFQRFELQISDSEPPPVAGRADWAHWAQFDVGWERRADKGFLIRLSMGAAILLNPSDLRCSPADAAVCQPMTSETLFTLDLGLGWAGAV